MKIEIEVPDDIVLNSLIDVAKDQIWHINSTIQTLKGKEDKPTYLLKDLQDFYSILEATNKLIKYFGGKPVEVRSATVIPGLDLDGNPFDK